MARQRLSLIGSQPHASQNIHECCVFSKDRLGSTSGSALVAFMAAGYTVPGRQCSQPGAARAAGALRAVRLRLLRLRPARGGALRPGGRGGHEALRLPRPGPRGRRRGRAHHRLVGARPSLLVFPTKPSMPGTCTQGAPSGGAMAGPAPRRQVPAVVDRHMHSVLIINLHCPGGLHVAGEHVHHANAWPPCLPATGPLALRWEARMLWCCNAGGAPDVAAEGWAACAPRLPAPGGAGGRGRARACARAGGPGLGRRWVRVALKPKSCAGPACLGHAGGWGGRVRSSPAP